MKKRLLSILLILVMVLSMLPAAFAEEAAEYGPVGENLIVNGSFEQLDENGLPVGVVANGGDGTFFGATSSHTVVTGEDNVSDGDYAVAVYDNDGRTCRVALSATGVEQGKTYVFSYKVKGDTENPWSPGNYYQLGGSVVYLTAAGEVWKDISAEYNVIPNEDDWTTLTYIFEATEAASKLNFYIGAGWRPWRCTIDEVSLYEYGELEPDAPSFDPVPVELVNPSLEQSANGTDPDGWAIATPANVTWSVDAASDGTKSLKIAYAGEGTSGHVYADYVMEGALPGGTYRLTYDVRGELKNANGDKVSVGADLHLRAGTSILQTLTPGTETYSATEWTTVSIEFEMPADADNVRLRPGFAWRSGTVYYDNVTLTMIDPPEGYVPPEPEPDEPDVFVPVDVALVNPGFAAVTGNAADGWTSSHPWGGANVSINIYQLTVDANSAKLTGIDGTPVYIEQVVDHIVPCAEYTLKFDVRSLSGMTPTAEDGGFGVELIPYDSEGNVIACDFLGVKGLTPGTTFERDIPVVFTTPAGTASLAVRPFVVNSGSDVVYMDAFRLTQTGAAQTPSEPEKPEFEPFALQLINPSFEYGMTADDTQGWTYPAWNAAAVRMASDVASDGKMSAKLDYYGDTALEVYVDYKAVDMVPGATYKVTADVYGSITKLSDGSAGSIGFAWHPKDASANWVGTLIQGTGITPNEDGWQTLEWEVTNPEGSTNPVLRLGYYNVKGTVYVDNLTMTMIDAPEGYVPPEPKPEFEPIPVELDNGSFEISYDGGLTVKGWTPSSAANVSYVTGDATDGDVSCRLQNEANTPALHVYNDYKVKRLIPGGTYKIEYDIKGELTWLGDPNAESATNSGLSILPYDYTDTWVEGAKLVSTAYTKVTEDWQHTEGYVTLVEGCTRIKIRAEIYNHGGWVCIDNFKMTLVDVPEGVDPYAPTEPSGDDAPKASIENSVDGIQMIANPSFEEIDPETGKAVGYEYYIQYETADKTLPTIELNTDPQYVHTGTNSLRMTALAQSGFVCVAPRADVITGATYTVSYWVKGETGGPVNIGLVFGVKENGSYKDMNTYGVISDAPSVSPEPDRWQHVVATFEAPVERDYVTVYVRIPWVKGEIYVDDVEMYMTALPKSDSIDGLQWMENGGFEVVTDGVSDGHSFSGDVSVQSTDACEGVNALQLNGPDAAVTMPVQDVVPGGTYRVSFKHKGEGSVTLSADVYGAAGQLLKAAAMGEAASAEQWEEFAGYVALPSNAKSMDVKLTTSGAAFADDVQMVLVSGPELAELLPEQVFFYYGEQETGSATTYFYEGYYADKTCVVDYQLLDGETVLFEQKDVSVADDKAVFEFDMDLLTQKQYGYTVKATVRTKGTELVRAEMAHEIYVYDRPLALNENGEFLDGDYDGNGNYVPNGEIFTPVIGFEVPGIRTNASVGNGELSYETLDKLLEGGINTVLYYPAVDLAGAINYDRVMEELDMLQEYGMKALIMCYWGMMPAGHPSNIDRVGDYIEKIHQHPAIYAWYSADEPYSNAINDIDSVYPNMVAGYKMIRDIDPVHPVYYTEDRDAFYKYSRYYADIICIDPYPASSLAYETMVGDRAALMEEATEGTRPVNAVLQAFTYQGSRPTDVQMRNMLYASYLGGAETLGYWAIQQSRDPVDLYDSEDLWPIIVSFNENEYPVIVEQYADGQGVFTARFRGTNAWYDLWEADGVSYLAIANRTKNAVIVNVPFDGEIGVLELVTQYNVTDTTLTKTASGFNVYLGASQAVLVKISGEGTEPEPETGLKIVTQPASYEGLVGDTVEFTVEATGEGLTYEWYYKAAGSDNWLKSYSTGATTDTLSVELRAYRDGQQYKCVVTDANGETVESEAAAMTLKVGEFAIVSQPASYAGAEGDTVTFTVVAEGDNLTYRWKYSTDGGETWKDSWSEGYATDTLTVELKAYRNGQQYKCVVTNAKGEAIESDAASMSLKESAIEITAQPENATVAAGETVTFTVEAEGENLKYRWYRSSDRETWTETWLAGYNTNELSFVVNATRAGYAYKCVITSGTNTVETEAVSVVIG